jgi:uncharacterized membrane protein YkgB
VKQLNTWTRPEPHWGESTAKTWAQLIGIILVALGILVLVGWAFNITFLKSTLPGLTPMKPNTAVSFLLVGLTLWLNPTTKSTTYKRLAQICALLVLLIGS